MGSYNRRERQLQEHHDVVASRQCDSLAVLEQGRCLDLDLADRADLLDERAKGMERPGNEAEQSVSGRAGGGAKSVHVMGQRLMQAQKRMLA